MGQIVKYFLDGIEINPPNNYRQLEIELNYDTDGNQAALSVNEWEFGIGDPSKGNDGMIMCRNQFLDASGVGVVQGKPFKITIDDEKGTIYELLDGYVDLWKAKYERGKITASATQTGKIDWLNDYADSFTFDYLYSIGIFDKSYFIPVPYVIVKKQNSFEVIITIVTVFVILDKLKEQIKDIAQSAASSSNPLELSAIPRFILQMVYVSALIVSLVSLILRIFSMLMPPVKYHMCMYVRDLFTIACKYMGFTFKSSILLAEPFNELVIMPEKYNLTNNTGIFAGIEGDFKSNNEQMGYFKGTFGDLIRAMKTMFYAKIVIDNDTIYFEKYNFRLGSNGIQVPYSFENQDSFTLNYNDFSSTMILSFLTDIGDRHTIQEYLGTSIQVTQTAKSNIVSKMSLLRNINEEIIQFALAKRKIELTLIETILSDFFKAINNTLKILYSAVNVAIKAINALIRIVNKIIKAMKTIGIKININISTIKPLSTSSLGNPISNRLGMLKMESDYVSIPKIFLLDKSSNSINTKLSANNESIVRAGYLFNNYHYFKSFVSIDGKENGQYILRESDKFPFSFSDYEQSLSNNAIFTTDGQEGKLISLRFNPWEQYATCTYKVKKDYITNLKVDIIEPDGK